MSISLAKTAAKERKTSRGEVRMGKHFQRPNALNIKIKTRDKPTSKIKLKISPHLFRTNRMNDPIFYL